MSWRARVTDNAYRPPGSAAGGRTVPGIRPRVPRPLAPGGRRDGQPGTSSQASLRPGAPPGAGRGAGGARSATTVNRTGPPVGRPPSAPTLRERPMRPLPRVAGGPGGRPPAAIAGHQPRRNPQPPPPPLRGAGSRVAVTRATAVPAGGPPAGSRPRSQGAPVARRGAGPAPVNTSVAVRTRGAGPRGAAAKITAVPVGPQSPPGAPPRARQVIIPAGTIQEGEPTVLDVPPTNVLEQPQQVLIDPGIVHEEETTVVVLPAPRSVGGSPVQARRDSTAERERAAAEAAAEAAFAERERVRLSKIAFANYLGGKPDAKSQKLRHELLMENDPEYCDRHTPINMERFTEDELKGAEELWDIDLEDVMDPDEPALRLQMSMNIEELPGRSPNTSFSAPGTAPGTAPGSPNTSFSERFSLPSTPPAPPSPPRYSPPRSPTFSERMNQLGDEYGFLEAMEAPEALYGEEASWEPPPPPPPLIRSPVFEEPVVHISPPRYIYQRYAPHDPEDLMWDWEEPPRPVAQPVEEDDPEPESYSAELFRLVRF